MSDLHVMLGALTKTNGRRDGLSSLLEWNQLGRYRKILQVLCYKFAAYDLVKARIWRSTGASFAVGIWDKQGDEVIAMHEVFPRLL